MFDVVHECELKLYRVEVAKKEVCGAEPFRLPYLLVWVLHVNWLRKK